MEIPTPHKRSLDDHIISLIKEKGLGTHITISPLDTGGSSSHDNYLIETDKGKYVLRVVKAVGALNHTDLESEYKILRLINSRDVAPTALAYEMVDGKPALLESYIEGKVASSSIFSPEDIVSCLDLLTQVSMAPITDEDFPFVFRYPSYDVSFPVWKERIGVVRNENPQVADDLEAITVQAQGTLSVLDEILKSVPQAFIYNDVHPGNLIFETSSHKAKFVDWQKVSLGDPTFMVVLFGERFASVFGMEKEAFRSKVQEMYQKRIPLAQFETLYEARAYERAVSDLVWTAWVKARKGEELDMNNETFQKLTESVRYWEGVHSKQSKSAKRV